MQRLEKDVTFGINDKEVEVPKDMTYKDLVNKINNGNYGVSVYSLVGNCSLHLQLGKKER